MEAVVCSVLHMIPCNGTLTEPLCLPVWMCLSTPLGEVLRLTHVARGLDSEGVLLIDIVVNGFCPPSLATSHLALQVCPPHHISFYIVPATPRSSQSTLCTVNVKVLHFVIQIHFILSSLTLLLLSFDCF